MLRKLRDEQENEEGFTLIELLVVVIIIGILAAIAIPAFLNQRERAYQAELTSAVRNYALEIESEATKNNGVYPAETDIDDVPDPGGAPEITYRYTRVSTTSFTLCGTTTKIAGDNSVTYSTALGGIQPYSETACTGGTVVS